MDSPRTLGAAGRAGFAKDWLPRDRRFDYGTRDAAVWVASDGFEAPDIVVMAEPSDLEVISLHTIEGLGLAADPVDKKLIPTVMPALASREQ